MSGHESGAGASPYATTTTSEGLMIYLGSFVFAAMAILVIVVFVKMFRQSND